MAAEVDGGMPASEPASKFPAVGLASRPVQHAAEPDGSTGADVQADMHEIFTKLAAAKSSAKLIKKKAVSGEAAARTRSSSGIVTNWGVRRIKHDAKVRPALARGFFAASKGKPFTPIGGPIDLDPKNHVKIAAETLANMRRKQELTDMERMHDSRVVPIDDARGIDVQLESYSSVMLRVRMADLKEAFVGRRKKLARSILIAMLDASGNPDLWMTSEEKLDTLGIPCRERHVWHSKDYVSIDPTDANYSATTYYIVVTSGVEHCKFRMVAATDQYMPTIATALKGTYRVSIYDRGTNICKTFIQPVLLEADYRRRNARVGCFPLAGYPMPHSIYAKKGSDPTIRPMSAAEVREAQASDLDASAHLQEPPPQGASDAASRPTSMLESPNHSRVVSQQASASSIRRPDSKLNTSASSMHNQAKSGNASLDVSLQGANHDEILGSPLEGTRTLARTRPRSALERIVDVTFKQTMNRVEADYDILDYKTVQMKNIKGLLHPRKTKYSHVGQQQKQLKALFGGAKKDLRAGKESFEEESDSSAASPRESSKAAHSVDMQESTFSAGHDAEMKALHQPSYENGQNLGDCVNGEEIKQGIEKEGATDDAEDEKASVGDEQKDSAISAEKSKAIKKARRRKNAPPLKIRLQWTPFRANLMAILAQAKPISRKFADCEYQELMTPVATMDGYAVVHQDGPGRRQLISDSDRGFLQLRPGQTMLVQAGSELPFGADAVVDAKFVVHETDFSTSPDVHVRVKDVAISGQHVKIEPRPYYVGEGLMSEKSARPGGYVTARDFMLLRFPHMVSEYDEMFKQQFLPHATKKAREALQMNEGMLAPLLQAVESCPSPLLQTLKASERRTLAMRCRIDILDAEHLLTREGDCEEVQGREARNMYILVAGEVTVYTFRPGPQDHTLIPSHATRTKSASSAASSTSEASRDDVRARARAEALQIEEKQFGKVLGNVSTVGSLLGERQLLFGEPWPVTVRGLVPYQVGCILQFSMCARCSMPVPVK